MAAESFARGLAVALVAAFCFGEALPGVMAENNSLERKPVLDWSSWSFLRKDPTAAKIKAQAFALHHSGLQALGYERVNIDDFWCECAGPQGPQVGPDGLRVVDSARFPPHGSTNGVKVVAD